MNIGVSAVYLLLSVLLLLKLKRKGACLSRLIMTGACLVLLLAAYLIRKSYAPAVSAQYLPLYKLFQLSEYGYQSILNDLLLFALPFLPAGLFLPLAFPGTGVLCSLISGAAAVFGMTLPSLILCVPFAADDYIYAALGMAVGTGISIILMHVFRNKPLFKQLGILPPFKSRLRASILLCSIVYFGIALTMIADFGEAYGELTMFTSDTPLPADITLSANLTNTSGRAGIYEADKQDVLQRSNETALSLGIDAEVQYIEDTYVYAEEGYILRYSPDGSWTYTSPAVPEGEAPSAEEAEALVRAFFTEKQPLNAELGELSEAALKTNAHLIPEFTEELGLTREQYDKMTELYNKPSGYDLYFRTRIDGSTVIGANEVMVSVREGGTITEIRKFDADLYKKAKARILTQEEAFQKLRDGEGAYTLFSPALSADFYSCELAYMVNSAQGYYLPVWRFLATAVMEDGTKTAFDAYVPALK